MAEVTYYFNSRSTGNWTDPDNMIDGLIANSAYTSSTDTTEILDGNTCPGDDLGTITVVEGRIYGYGDVDDELIVQIRLDEAHKGGIIDVPGTSPGWSSYFLVNVSTWADVMALTAHIIFRKVAKANTMHCAKVEIRVLYDRPKTETLRPNAPGDECWHQDEMGCSSCPDHYTCWDEESADGYTTCTATRGETSTHKDLCHIEDHSVGSGIINHVTVYWVCGYHGSAYDNCYLGVKSGATEDWGSEQTLAAPWITKSRQFTTDPNTGLAWTWDAVDALQVGYKTTQTNHGIYLTQIYVEVDYTPIGPPPEKVTQYLAGHDCPEFPHEMDLQADKLPCPPPY